MRNTRIEPQLLRDSEVGRLLLRASLGSTLIAHGVRHGRTIEGTARWFESIGFSHHRAQARLSAAVEVGAGSGVILGALTPAAASAIVGTMTVAGVSVHRTNGYFVVDEGYEYVATLAATAVALSALGPGRFSVDRATGLDRRLSGTAAAVGTVVAGVLGAAAQLRLFWKRPAGTSS